MNPPNSRSRWASIADELGLTSEPEPVPPPPSPTVEKAAEPAPAAPIEKPAPELEPESEPARGRKRRAVEEPVVEPAALEPPAESPEPEAPAVAEELGEPLPTEGTESTPQDERRRGRRRGRRGRGRRDAGETDLGTAEADKAPAALADSNASAEVMEAPTSEETTAPTVVEAGGEPTDAANKPKDKERSRRRGRGRTRKGSKPEEEGAEGAEKETTVAETITTEPEVADDGESEDVSGWEVPSWNELIAALYRPDR